MAKPKPKAQDERARSSAPHSRSAKPKPAAKAAKPKAKAPTSAPAPKAPAALKPAPKAAVPPARAAPTPISRDPSFVKETSAADRKALMAALAEDIVPLRPPHRPTPKAHDAPAPPPFVKQATPAERKAAVEQLAQDAGVAPILARAPWRSKSQAPPSPSRSPSPPSAPPTPPPLAAPKEPLRMAPPPPAKPEPRVGVSAKRPVLLDTNALMMQFQFHIDIEREMRRLLDFAHEIVVPSVVVEELETLAKEAKGKDAGEARMALELAKTFKTMDTPAGGGDTAILRLAEKLGNAIVVTNDKLLRARLRAKDIPNIYMRSSAFLTVDGHITGL